MIPITYLEFHLSFLVPPLSVLTTATVVRARRAIRRGNRLRVIGRRGRLRVIGVAAVTLLALGYTIPWDNYLISRGVWHYGEGRIAMWLWYAPLEEYVFIVLQPLVTALFLYQLPDEVDATVGMDWRARTGGALAGLLVGVAGLAMLSADPTYYMGAILAWAAPVLALQWAVGWRYLRRQWRRVALAVMVPSLYFWVADWLALRAGVWVISERYTTGLTVLGLPIEEATFFVVTNCFVVQGLVLLPWVVACWQEAGVGQRWRLAGREVTDGD